MFEKAGRSVLKEVSESETRLLSNLVARELGEGRPGVTQEVEPWWEVRECKIRLSVRRLWRPADRTAML